MPCLGMAVGDIVLANKLAYHDGCDGTAIVRSKWRITALPESSRYFVSEMKKVLEEEAATTHGLDYNRRASFIARVKKSRSNSGSISQKSWQLRWRAALPKPAHATERPFIVIRAMKLIRQIPRSQYADTYRRGWRTVCSNPDYRRLV